MPVCGEREREVKGGCKNFSRRKNYSGLSRDWGVSRGQYGPASLVLSHE